MNDGEQNRLAVEWKQLKSRLLNSLVLKTFSSYSITCVIEAKRSFMFSTKSSRFSSSNSHRFSFEWRRRDEDAARFYGNMRMVFCSYVSLYLALLSMQSSQTQSFPSSRVLCCFSFTISHKDSSRKNEFNEAKADSNSISLPLFYA